MADFRDDDPDWYRERYAPCCRKRKEQCQCGTPFAERARTVEMGYYRLRRYREGRYRDGGRP